MFDNEYVEYAANTAETKLTLLRTDPGRYLVRAILAGMYLSIAVFVYWMLSNDLHDVPFGKLVASGFFGVGLIMIVFTNTELFTSNNLYMTISSAQGKTSWWHTSFLWAICYIGNLVGAGLVAYLLSASGILGSLSPDHALFAGAEHKVHQSAIVIFHKGILANWIVCLGVRIAIRCREEIAKIVVLLLIVFMFLYFGGEHSIANMGTFTQALVAGNAITMNEALYNLLFATAGNIVGGALFMAIPFTYINPPEEVGETTQKNPD